MTSVYRIRLHHDLRTRPWWALLWRPWWATMTYGCGIIGEPGAGVWRARSAEDLERKCRRWIKRDALRRGRIDEPIVHVVGP